MDRHFPSKTRVLTVFAAWFALGFQAAHADVPRLIHFQGKLLTMTGAQVAGPLDVQVKLYADATSLGPVLFDESHNDLELTNALFSLLIGSETPGGVPDSVLASGELWLGITINGGNELSPRSQVVTSPYASRSRAAETLVPPGGTSAAVAVDAAGRVGVNTAAPDASAALEVSSTSRGMLPPRMTTGQRDAIASPATGLQVFNTTTSCLQFFVGGVWQNIACACSTAPETPGPIDGPATLCANAEDAVFSIASINGAESYAWTVPPGASITSGQGTAAITVTIGSTGGNIIVNAANACGASADRTLALSVSCPSCLALKTVAPGATSGVYEIDPDGAGAEPPFNVYCEMTLNGGGWTLVATRNTSTSPTSESEYGTDLSNPTVNADNMYKGTWSNLGYSTALYQLNDYASNYYMENINTQAMQDYGRTAITTIRPAQAFRPDCRTELSGGTFYSGCGSAGDGSARGWVFDPSGGWCWWAYAVHQGAGRCNNSSSGVRARIWVR